MSAYDARGYSACGLQASRSSFQSGGRSAKGGAVCAMAMAERWLSESILLLIALT
jgi:hypothetical protein